MNICVFGSSSEQIDKIYLESAEHLGKRLPKTATTLFSVRENTVLWAHLPEAHTAQVATQSELHPIFY